MREDIEKDETYGKEQRCDVDGRSDPAACEAFFINAGPDADEDQEGKGQEDEVPEQKDQGKRGVAGALDGGEADDRWYSNSQ